MHEKPCLIPIFINPYLVPYETLFMVVSCMLCNCILRKGENDGSKYFLISLHAKILVLITSQTGIQLLCNCILRKGENDGSKYFLISLHAKILVLITSQTCIQLSDRGRQKQILILYVCVVLRIYGPVNSMGSLSSRVSLPNHTFTGQA